MNVHECAKVIDAEILVPPENDDMDIKVACGADLMSDVMAFACTYNEMMLTGLCNPQAIRTAEMMDIKAVVFVRGKRPDASILDLAKDRSICVMSTQLPMFTACGLLHQAGILGKGE